MVIALWKGVYLMVPFLCEQVLGDHPQDHGTRLRHIPAQQGLRQGIEGEESRGL